MGDELVRRFPRVPCGASARLSTGSGVVRGVCRDLSAGGMFFVGPMLPVGEQVTVALVLPRGPVQLPGVVRYQHAFADSTGIGIRFEAVAPEVLRQLEWVIALCLRRLRTTPPPILFQPPAKGPLSA